ncbi:peptidylprolyl isomerase [Gemmatimonadota bacterium]
MEFRGLSSAIVLSVVLGSPTLAQDVLRVPVDGIAAIVGDTPIPMSRIDEQLQTFRGQGGEIPTDPDGLATLRRQLLDGVIDDELLIQAAERDTMVVVTDEDVQSVVDEAIQQIRDGFGSQADLERDLQAAGFGSLDDYRLYRAEQQRRELLRSTLLQQLRQMGEMRPLPPTEAEMRDAFERTRAQHPRRPATVSFRQVVVATEPDSAALMDAFRRADSLRGRLLDGEDFGALALAHSDDIGTKEQGGNLGWVRRGQGLVREFESAAFQLQPGAYSRPVLTPFGFHLIQVQRAEPASVQVRHILCAPGFTDENRERARSRADSVVEMLRQGVPIDSLAGLYHDPTEERLVEDVPREGLPAPYQEPLAAAEPGQVIGPVVLDRGNDRTLYAAIVFVEARPEGTAEFEDLRDQLWEGLGEENAIRRYIETLRAATYIDIRI